MASTVADYLLERLRAWDVRHVFAYAGDGINGILAAWGRAENKPQFIQARHEEMAAFEAVGYAKFTGRVGVCMATSGPGDIHLLNGLYDAKLDHVPVVAIVGQTNRSAMGGSYQQEVDLLSLFKDVASEYVQMVTVPEQLPNVLDRAVRVALAEGCKVNAKASPLITHVPDALAHGAEVRADAMVTRIAIDRGSGRALGVHYVRDGRERFQRAAMVAVAGYSIETPRLLLNSACSRFPDGVGNDFDQVGRYLMVQGAPQTAGRFDAEVRMYKAPPPEVSTEQFYETHPARGFQRGFSVQTVSPLPITWAEHVAAQGHWGGGHPARRGRGRGHHHPAVRPPGRQGPDGRGRTQWCRRPVLPQLRRAEPVHHRRQRAAHPGCGQPGPDHHGRSRPRRRSPGRRGPLWERVVNDPQVESVTAATYTVPTDAPEADGMLAWDSVTLVLAQVRAGGEQGIGWTYGSPACAAVISGMLAGVAARATLPVGPDGSSSTKRNALGRLAPGQTRLARLAQRGLQTGLRPGSTLGGSGAEAERTNRTRPAGGFRTPAPSRHLDQARTDRRSPS